MVRGGEEQSRVGGRVCAELLSSREAATLGRMNASFLLLGEEKSFLAFAFVVGKFSVVK